MAEINDFYTNQSLIEGFGRSRVNQVIHQLRQVWPGAFPKHHTPVTEYYAAWILFILCKCRTTKKEDVVRAINHGKELRNKKGQLFITEFAGLLREPKVIRDGIRSIFVFYDEDNMVSISTEVDSAHRGANLIFHGKSPAYKIRRSAILEKEFLLEIANLIHADVLEQDRINRSQKAIED